MIDIVLIIRALTLGLGSVFRPARLRFSPRRAGGTALLALLLASVSSGAVSDLGVEEIVFARRQPGVGGHWYENFGYYAQDESLKVYGARGSLCRLHVESGKLTVLLDDPHGSIRDPQVHYDGGKIQIGRASCRERVYHPV